MYVGNAPLTALVKTPHPLPGIPPHALTDVSGDVWGLCYIDRDAVTAYYNLIPDCGDVYWRPLTQMVVQGQWGVMCEWWLTHLPHPNSQAFLRSCWNCHSEGYVRPTCISCQAFQVAHRVAGCQDCVNAEAVHSLRPTTIASWFATV